MANKNFSNKSVSVIGKSAKREFSVFGECVRMVRRISLNIAVGQEVSDAVVNELKNCVPPTWLGGGLFQVGEPKDQDAEHPAWAIYDTFKRSENGWVYLGACLRGQTEARKGYIEGLYNI